MAQEDRPVNLLSIISYVPSPDPVARKERKRRKRGRPKVHWTKNVARQRRRCLERLRRKDVIELIQADRFASRTGNRLGTFITIRWSRTAQGERAINKRWIALLNALRTWASRHGFELHHVWVHENPPREEPAFNTHILANIPSDLRGAAVEWLMKQLGGSTDAIDMQPRVRADWKKPDDRMSYMCKGTDWATANKFKLIRRHGWDFNQGIVSFKRCGTSRNINSRASNAIEPGLSEFRDQYTRARQAA